MSCCTNNTFCKVLATTFKTGDESPERQRFNRILWTRAWISNSLLAAFRVSNWIRGKTGWDTFENNKAIMLGHQIKVVEFVGEDCLLSHVFKQFIRALRNNKRIKERLFKKTLLDLCLNKFNKRGIEMINI